jgi:chemotaxis protein CheZ
VGHEEPVINLEQAKQLVEFLEQGKAAQVNALMTLVCAPNTGMLFEQVGQLTRQLHDSLNDFQLDTRISEIATNEIPDARQRLNYVIEMTDSAANRTMDAVEVSLPLADKLNECIQSVMPSWQNLMKRNLSVGEFKVLCHQLDDFLSESAGDANKLRSSLTDILMAQDFQDLTGQMIRRVITLVQEVEDSLVKILTLFADVDREAPKNEPVAAAPVADITPEGPIMNSELRDDVVNGQDDVDDLLSSLGF